MVLNAFAVLDLFLVALRLLLGILVLCLTGVSFRQMAASGPGEKKTALEDRGYLLFLLAILLVGLNLVSWPLLYLLLQSYVTEWPGIMCIYGVTQIGAGSLGPSRYLPSLIQTLQLTKPALVFLGGGWFVLYLINRRTQTAPLGNRVLVALAGLGLFATLDASAEAAYLIIPKKEEFQPLGCCTGAFDVNDRASRFVPQALFGEDYHARLTAGYYGINLAMVLALFVASRPWKGPPSRRGLFLLAAGAMLSLAVSGLFLLEIAAPTLLHLPYHHCPYDLLPQVPESVLSLALLLLGAFAVGWAALGGWLGRAPETRPFLGDFLRQLLFIGLLGFLGSVALMFVEMALP